MNELFNKKIKEWEIPFFIERKEKLNSFAEKIIDKNKKINLISRKDISNLWLRHILDSLALIPSLKKININLENKEVADLGSGGGFPAIILSIFMEKTNFTLIESNLKKYEFLLWIKYELKLNNVKILNERLMKNSNFPFLFDFFTQRAAGEIDSILPLCFNFIKENSFLAVWQKQENQKNLEKTKKPYFIYNYSLDKEKENSIFLFRRDNACT